MKKIILLLVLSLGSSLGLSAQLIPSTPGTISGNQTINFGDRPQTITSVTPASGDRVSYRWEQSTNKYTWTSAESSNTGSGADSYQPPELTTTTYYRRVALTRQDTKYSNVVTITVRPLLPGSISGDQTISVGATPSAITSSAPASGSPFIIYQWQSSVDNSTWVNTGPNSAVFNPRPFTATTYFRRAAREIRTGTIVYSNTVTIAVTNAVTNAWHSFIPVENVVAFANVSDKTRGLKTYERAAVLDGTAVPGTPTYVERVFYYDYRGRLIQTVERNHLGGVSVYSTKYDFVGNVLASHEMHGTDMEIITPDDYEPLVSGKYFSRYNFMTPIVDFSSVDPEGKYFGADGVLQKYYLGTKPGERRLVIGSDGQPLRAPDGTYAYITILPTDYYYIPEDYLSIAQAGEMLASNFAIVMELPEEVDVIPKTHLGTYPHYGSDLNTKLTTFEYDDRSRLKIETTTVNDGTPAIVTYAYDDLGRLKNKALGESTITMDQIPVGTNIRGWTFRIDKSKPFPMAPKGDALNLSLIINNSDDTGVVAVAAGGSAFIGMLNIAVEADTLALAVIGWNYMDTFTIKDDKDYIVTQNNLWTGDATSWGFDSIHKMGVTETYDYNIQGWLTEQNSTLFNMKLRYYDPQKTATAKSYTGNITEWEWTQKGTGITTPKVNTYAFAYDKLSRLTTSARYEGTSNTALNSFTERDIAYDRNGNFNSMKRYGSNTSTPVDNIGTAVYSGNQIESIQNNTTTHTYAYDNNGNITIDGLNALKLEYNYLNLTAVVRNNSNAVQAQYRWLADGSKVGVRNSATGTQGYEYLGSLVYKRTGASTVTLESAAFGGGRILKATNGYEINYFLADHLGSTRVVFKPTGTSGLAIVERNDYYPFGGRHENPQLAASTTIRHRFSGKENQTTGNLPYQDFGARFFGAKLPIWTAVDPLAEKYYSWSPYNYTLGNPVNYIDPLGLDVWEMNRRGEVRYIDDSETRHVMYAINNEGTRTGASVVIFDRSIFDQLTRTGAASGYTKSYATGYESPTELASVFLFASDNSDVEWRFSRYKGKDILGKYIGDLYALGTVHKDSSAITPEQMEYDPKDEIASIHSHPGIGTSINGWGGEYGSMGWISTNEYYSPSDVTNVVNKFREYPSYKLMYVYFPNSGNIHHGRGYLQPAFIRNIKGHNYNGQRLFWGTLNDR